MIPLPSLSPSTWVILGLSIALAGALLLLKVANERAASWERTYNTFVAGVEAAGRARMARNKEIAAEQAKIVKETQEHADELYAALDMQYRTTVDALAAARLRKPGDSGGSGVRTLAEAPRSLGCTEGQADPAGRLQQAEERFAQFDLGVLALLHRGNKAIAETIVCGEYLDRIEAIRR